MNIRTPSLETHKKDHLLQHILSPHYHKYIPYSAGYNRNQEYPVEEDMYQNNLMKKYLYTIDLP